jgi:hypothetical protein
MKKILRLLTIGGAMMLSALQVNALTYGSYRLQEDFTGLSAFPSGWSGSGNSSTVANDVWNCTATGSGNRSGTLAFPNSGSEKVVYMEYDLILTNAYVANKNAFFMVLFDSSNNPIFNIYCSGNDGKFHLQNLDNTIEALSPVTSAGAFNTSDSNNNDCNAANASTITSVTWATGNTYHITALLDFENHKIVKLNIGATTIASNVDFMSTSASNIASILTLNTRSSKDGNGSNANITVSIDNIDFGSLVADNIKDLTGDSEIQTLSSTVSKIYSATCFTAVMNTDLAFAAGTALNVQWSISDYGTLSVSDQALVSLTRSATDYASATLAVLDAVSADATITVKATFNSIDVTKQVLLKAAGISALKDALLAEINAAAALDDAIAGSNPYLTDITVTLADAIAAAQLVYDNPSATTTDVGGAITTLQDAEDAFLGDLAVYDDFVEAIAAAQTTHDAETRPTNLKTALLAEIYIATAAESTVASASDISSATSTLAAAVLAFSEGITSYNAFATSIATVTARYNVANARTGTKFLNYNAADVALLNGAIGTANTALTNAGTATDLDDAKTTVETALATFNAAGRVAPESYPPMVYKIYTYGVNDGDGNSDKKILYADGSTLKWILVASATGDEDDEWIIEQTATNSYTIKNNSTGEYLTGTGLAASSAVFTLPENTAQNTATIKVDDGYFLYGIVNSSSRALELDGTDTFLTSSAIANRLRFSFQFEEYDTTTGVSASGASKTAVSSSYYDLTGKPVPASSKGFVIKKTVYSDGSVENSKAIIK